jgi:hypothetical protein
VGEARNQEEVESDLLCNKCDLQQGWANVRRRVDGKFRRRWDGQDPEGVRLGISSDLTRLSTHRKPLSEWSNEAHIRSKLELRLGRHFQCFLAAVYHSRSAASTLVFVEWAQDVSVWTNIRWIAHICKEIQVWLSEVVLSRLSRIVRILLDSLDDLDGCHQLLHHAVKWIPNTCEES